MSLESDLAYVQNVFNEIFSRGGEELLYTGGRRYGGAGISRNDTALMDGYEIQEIIDQMEKEGYGIETKGGKSFAFVSPEWSREDLSRLCEGKRVIAGGGMPNIISMAAQHHWSGFDYPYTIGMMQEAQNEGETLRYIIDYPRALRESIEETGEETFEEVHGVNLETYPEMTHQQFMEVGRSEESKEAGVKHPNWTLTKVHPSGETEGVLEVTEVPFNVGVDCFLGYVGPGVQTVVGSRGASTKLGVGTLENKEDFLRKIEGSEDFMDELRYTLEGRPEDTTAVEIAAETKVVRGDPEKIYDLLGVEFYTDNTPEIL